MVISLVILRKGIAVKYNRNVYHALMMISQFGINMLVPIFLCTFIGIAIDRKFETSYFAVVLFFIGAFAGFRNVFRFAKKIYEVPAETRRRRNVDQDVQEVYKNGEKLEEEN